MFIARVRTTFEYKRYTTALDLFSGDEPKYLRLVHTLAEDADLDISNFWGSEAQIARLRETAPSSGTRRSGHLYIFGKKSGIYSLHLPGLAVLTYPGYVADVLLFPLESARASSNLDFLPAKLYFTRLSLVIIALLSLLALFRLLGSVFSPLLTSLLFLPLLFNSPFLRFTVQLYPDGPALLFCLLGLNCIFRPFRDRRLNDVLFAFCLAFLPWLHQRFIFLSLGLYLLFLFLTPKKPASRRRILLVSLALLASSLPYFYYFYSITGDPSPASLSREYGQRFISLGILPLGFFGQVFSTREGLLWFYPWTSFFLFGFYYGFKRRMRQTGALLMAFFPYYLVCSTAFPWSGASAPVGRFAVALLPIYLLFTGFTVEDLSRRFSWKKLFYYASVILLIFLNHQFSVLRLDIGHTRVTPSELGRISLAALLLILLFASLWFGEKRLFKPSGPSPEQNYPGRPQPSRP